MQKLRNEMRGSDDTAVRVVNDYQNATSRDYDEALKWYTLGAKQGNTAGQAGLDRLTGGLNAGRGR